MLTITDVQMAGRTHYTITILFNYFFSRRLLRFGRGRRVSQPSRRTIGTFSKCHGTRSVTRAILYLTC